jgi:hypothetical protein
MNKSRVERWKLGGGHERRARLRERDRKTQHGTCADLRFFVVHASHDGIAFPLPASMVGW